MVYHCLLGMADNKLQRRHLTTQHTTRPVATPRPPSTTPPRLAPHYCTTTYAAWAATPKPRSIILPRATLPEVRVLHRCSEVLHHQGTGVLHYYISWVNILLRGVLICQLLIQIIYCLVVWKERKGERIQQPSENFRYSNRKCRALVVINFILRRVTSV